MRIVTKHTTSALDDPMHRVPGLVLVQHLSHIAMAGDANFERAFCPKVIPVLTAMRIMAQDAARDHGTVEMFFGLQIFFAGMTDKTDIVNFSRRNPNSPGLAGLLVTYKALIIYRGAVPPFAPVDKIVVANCAVYLSLHRPQRIYAGALLQIVAIQASVRQFIVLMKAEGHFIKGFPM
jgi:hypothetical protein